MNFDKLHETIPYARYGKEKSLEMKPYPGITLAMPGRHAEDCTPKGGDYVVMVDDKDLKWKRHQFKHADLFHDIQLKHDADGVLTDILVQSYYGVVFLGDDPKTSGIPGPLPGLDSRTFLYATQCLAVAEHRRYAQHEEKFGGRFLPFRFVSGIAQGLWTAEAGTEVQKYGRPAVEKLEKENGTPFLTKCLMGLDTLSTVV